MKDLARHKACGLEVEDGLHDVADLAHALQGMHRSQEFVSLRRMHRSLDDAGGNGVHANALRGIFDGERLCDRVDAALGQDGERGWDARAVMDGAGGYGVS